MKLFNIILGLALSLASLAAADKLNVVATTSDLGAIARSIGGDHVSVSVLARPTEDSHFVDAKPSFQAKLRNADLLIEGGADLEAGWLGPLLEGARNSKIARGASGHFAAAQGLTMLEVPAQLDRSQGDVHAAGNPHFMMDPMRVLTVASNLTKAMTSLRPACGSAFETQGAKFATDLAGATARWQALLAPHRGKRIVSYHNSWPYFAERFGLKMDLFLEPKPGIPPTPAHLNRITQKMKEEGVKVIFAEPFVGKRTAQTVAADTGSQVISVSQFPGGVKGTDGGYIELMDYIVTALAKAL